jgi:hypothetical protein
MNNRVKTNKYTVLTFLPKNLFLQFSKMANFYFLVLILLELVPIITDDTSVPPVLVYPLTFVVGLSMIKDAYEDYVRYRSDSEENSRKAQTLFNHELIDFGESPTNKNKINVQESVSHSMSNSITAELPEQLLGEQKDENKAYEPKIWEEVRVGDIIKV